MYSYLLKPYNSGWEEGMVSLEGGKSKVVLIHC